METSWIVYMAIMFGIIFGASSFEAYTKSECVKAYATSTRTADDIAKICKVKQ